MARFACMCGFVLGDSLVPCDHEYHMISDAAIEPLVKVALEGAKSEDPEAQVSFQIMQAGVTVNKCPNCGRLLVYWQGPQGACDILHPRKKARSKVSLGRRRLISASLRISALEMAERTYATQ